jgi:hypothetical protein
MTLVTNAGGFYATSFQSFSHHYTTQTQCQCIFCPMHAVYIYISVNAQCTDCGFSCLGVFAMTMVLMWWWLAALLVQNIRSSCCSHDDMINCGFN